MFSAILDSRLSKWVRAKCRLFGGAVSTLWLGEADHQADYESAYESNYGADSGAVYGADSGAVYGANSGAVYGANSGAVYDADSDAAFTAAVAARASKLWPENLPCRCWKGPHGHGGHGHGHGGVPNQTQ